MSILSVDNISPIGSGTSVTINNAATLVLNNLSIAGVVTATSFAGSGASLTNLPSAQLTGALPAIDGSNLTGISAGTSLSGSTNNTVCTVTGANAITGEANLTFDGNILTATQGNSAIGAIIKNTAHDSELQILATYANKNSKLLFGDAADGDIGQIDYDHNDNSLSFTVNTSERLRIDSSGRFLKGLTGAGASRSSTSVRYPHFQLSSPWSSGLGSYKIECTDDYPIIFLDSNASYANGTGAGTVTWSVKDSSGDYCNTASILSKIDATPSNDSAPGRLEFLTTTSGSTPTTKMTIDSGGSVLKPLNPAFYANNLSNNAVYTAGTIIPWPNTNVDTRSAFATSGSDIGRYTIPTTGIYFFGWRLNRLGDSRFDLAIYVNGSIKYYDELRSDAGSGIWQAESGHYIFNCTAGQKIDLRVASVTNAGSGQFDGGQLYDGFFGWMIG